MFNYGNIEVEFVTFYRVCKDIVLPCLGDILKQISLEGATFSLSIFPLTQICKLNVPSPSLIVFLCHVNVITCTINNVYETAT